MEPDTIQFINKQMTKNTSACKQATVHFDPFLGIVNNMPGTRMKNNNPVKKVYNISSNILGYITQR
jgi:hypothetical protein